MNLSSALWTGPAFLAYLLAFGLATVACLAGAWQAQALRHTETRRGLQALLLTSGGWAFSHVGFLLPAGPLVKDLFYQGGLIVGFATVWAWLWFCSAYTGRSLHQNPSVRKLALLIFGAVVLVKLTNPWHQLYYTIEPAGPAGLFPGQLVVEHHVLYWAAMGLSYALAAAGYLMLLELFVTTDTDTTALSVLAGLTAVPAVLDVIGHTQPALLNFTHEPLGVAVFAVGTLQAYRYKFESVRVTSGRSEPALTLSPDGNILDLNRSARALLEKTRATEETGLSPVGQRLEDLAPDLDALAQGTEERLSLELEGDRRHFLAGETRVGSGQGPRILLLKDVTEQKRREEALAEAKAEAERLDRLKSAFLINVSHEVRTPLTSMIGYAETIREELSAGDESAPSPASPDRSGSDHDGTDQPSQEQLIGRFAAQIQESGTRLMRTVDDLLDLSKLEAGMTETEEGTVDVGAQVGFIAEEFRPVADTKGVELAAEADGDGPLARANRPGVRAVLRNLVSNAIKFTPEGGTVAVRARRAQERPALEVEDDGIGMDPARVDDYFQPFEQAEGGNGGEKAGLGLALVRRATREMSGSIEVETEKGVGTRIRILLPPA
jgi:signal transduction histidine kinase